MDIIWEERNLTDHNRNSLKSDEKDNCGIIIGIKNDSMKKEQNDTTKISGIYKIINKINGMYYVGRTKCINDRWKRGHIYKLNKNIHENDYLQNAWNKYGYNTFEFVIVEVEPDLKKLVLIEQKYLDIAYTEQDKCYNLKFNANRGCVALSLYSRNKISESKKGIPLSYEHKRKVIAANVGRKRPINAIIITANKLKGRTHSIDTKIKMSKPKSITHKHNVSLARRNKQEYKFQNKITREIFNGTQYQFYTKYNLLATHVNRLVKNKIKSTSNWILFRE